ncbi:ppiA [Symbiodinium natans]|uniref:PpiA protein n=1 Tax=Symbiodinium natans TaxID=878477 RepID=A0A812NH71_9DINO|nr:ppiA [Symbiodinium natans]
MCGKSEHRVQVQPQHEGRTTSGQLALTAAVVQASSFVVESFGLRIQACHMYGNFHARSGLRYLDEGKRQYFRLAVQQAEASFGIKANHPLFFTWTQDPLALVTGKVEAAWRFFMVTVAAHFFTNLFLVIVALLGFSKLGHW